jgi:hypothetical protein
MDRRGKYELLVVEIRVLEQTSQFENQNLARIGLA